MSRSAFQLKGGGWYSDLYASKKKEAPAKEGAEAAPSAKAEATADAKAEKKPEVKPPAVKPEPAKAPAADGGKKERKKAG